MKHTLVFHLIGLSKKLQGAIGLKSPLLPFSYSQAAALLVIDSLPKVSQIDIAKKLHLKPASVVTMIDQLEKFHLVKRRVQAQNRRAYQIELTTTGESEVVNIKKQAWQVENLLKSKLTRQELQSFKSIIEKLTKVMDEAHTQTINRKEVKNELLSTKRYVAP
jgi:DNA-binding MarR family transcriptional regulator